MRRSTQAKKSGEYLKGKKRYKNNSAEPNIKKKPAQRPKKLHIQPKPEFKSKQCLRV